MNIKEQWIDSFEERLWEHHTCDWDVVIEILNKLQASNPGHTMERVNKYINDEIYEWFNEQPLEEDSLK